MQFSHGIRGWQHHLLPLQMTSNFDDQITQKLDLSV
jgi:hypothetical protein